MQMLVVVKHLDINAQLATILTIHEHELIK